MRVGPVRQGWIKEENALFTRMESRLIKAVTWTLHAEHPGEVLDFAPSDRLIKIFHGSC